jgi:hypothetical protein
VIEADVLALSLGRVPNDELAEELRRHGLRVLEAGDCQSPRSIEEAILEGTMAARELAHEAEHSYGERRAETT